MDAATSVKGAGLVAIAGALVAAAPASVPVLKPIDRTALQRLISVDLHRLQAGTEFRGIAVLGGFRIVLPRGERVVRATLPGYLSVALMTNRGRCFFAAADYVDGRLTSPTIKHATCSTPPMATAAGEMPGRRLAGEAWGYRAWVDERDGTTLLTKSRGATVQELATVRMRTIGLGAIDSPDSPLSNITLVGSTMEGNLMLVLALR